MSCFPCFQKKEESSNNNDEDVPIAEPKDLAPPPSPPGLILPLFYYMLTSFSFWIINEIRIYQKYAIYDENAYTCLCGYTI